MLKIFIYVFNYTFIICFQKQNTKKINELLDNKLILKIEILDNRYLI